MITLYDYFRSSASYRVRIALNLKNLHYHLEAVHLVQSGGEQFTQDYVALNPQKLVPTLQDEDNGLTMTQSLAIIEYLEEQYPNPRLFPEDPRLRASIRSFALAVACDIHPLNNLRVLKYLKNTLHITDEQKQSWYQHWILEGFEAIETRLKKENNMGQYCFGDSITLADICLIPQVYNANRFDCPMDDFPLIQRVNENCLKHPAFEKASPDNQPDANL